MKNKISSLFFYPLLHLVVIFIILSVDNYYNFFFNDMVYYSFETAVLYVYMTGCYSSCLYGFPFGIILVHTLIAFPIVLFLQKVPLINRNFKKIFKFLAITLCLIIVLNIILGMISPLVQSQKYASAREDEENFAIEYGINESELRITSQFISINEESIVVTDIDGIKIKTIQMLQPIGSKNLVGYVSPQGSYYIELVNRGFDTALVKSASGTEMFEIYDPKGQRLDTDDRTLKWSNDERYIARRESGALVVYDVLQKQRFVLHGARDGSVIRSLDWSDDSNILYYSDDEKMYKIDNISDITVSEKARPNIVVMDNVVACKNIEIDGSNIYCMVNYKESSWSILGLGSDNKDDEFAIVRQKIDQDSAKDLVNLSPFPIYSPYYLLAVNDNIIHVQSWGGKYLLLDMSLNKWLLDSENELGFDDSSDNILNRKSYAYDAPVVYIGN